MKQFLVLLSLTALAAVPVAAQTCTVSGDVNGDEDFNRADPEFLLEYLFLDGCDPVCPDEADANGDGDVDIADAVTMYNLLTPCALATLGDVNGSGSLAMADVDYLLNWLFASGPDPVPCDDVADVNGDGSFSIGDAAALAAILPCPPDLLGDANGDEKFDIADLIVVGESFAGGDGPVPCELAGDINQDGDFDIADFVVYLDIFSGGGPLCTP